MWVQEGKHTFVHLLTWLCVYHSAQDFPFVLYLHSMKGKDQTKELKILGGYSLNLKVLHHVSFPIALFYFVELVRVNSADMKDEYSLVESMSVLKQLY